MLLLRKEAKLLLRQQPVDNQGVVFYRSTILFIFTTKLVRNYFFTIWLELYGVLGERYYFFVKIGVIFFFKPIPLIINWSLPKGKIAYLRDLTCLTVSRCWFKSRLTCETCIHIPLSHPALTGGTVSITSTMPVVTHSSTSEQIHNTKSVNTAKH